MIWRSMAALLVALLVAMVGITSAAFAQRSDDWELLGATRIGGYGFDLDEIEVGQSKGRFETIRIRARSNSVYIRGLRVVFGDDEAQEIRVGDRLREGEQTAPIDLAGGERFIKRIEITARTRGRRRAVVEIYAIPAPAWERIGSRNVRGHGVNLSTFLVPRGMGPFTSVRLQVKRRDVYILGLRVAFKNGKAQDIRVRKNIRRGKSTRPFDLSGFNRGIEHIEVVYRPRPGFGRRGVIEVYGEVVRRPRWEELGCQKVGFFADRDVIRVGSKEGHISAIQLRVSGATVYMQDLKVIYDRGSPHSIPVRAQIRAGGETKSLDLRGDRRHIKRIELSYGAKLSVGSRPVVCVYGRQ